MVTYNDPRLSDYIIAQATTLTEHRPYIHQVVVIINLNIGFATASSKVPFYNTAFINNRILYNTARSDTNIIAYNTVLYITKWRNNYIVTYAGSR